VPSSVSGRRRPGSPRLPSSAIGRSSWRARATIPTFRARGPPGAKRVRYHCVSALCG
jgi:hypothetical protein